MFFRGYKCVRLLRNSLRGCKSQSPSAPFGDAENLSFCLESNSDIQSSCAAVIENSTKEDITLINVYVLLPDCTTT
jgi:hypothetical protein